MNKLSGLALFAYWVLWRTIQHVFSNEGRHDGVVQVSANHYLLMLCTLALISVLVFIHFWIRYKVLVHVIVKLQFLLICYSLVSVLWSPVVFVSLGQAIYSLINLIFAAMLGSYFFASDERSSGFARFWSLLLIADYLLSIAFRYSVNGIFSLVPLDEKALIAIVVFLLFSATQKNNFIYKILMLFLFAFGKSMSALIFGCGVLLYRAYRKSLLYAVVCVSCVSSLVAYMARLVMSGDVTIYGKSMDLILTGSGRFNVYSSMLDAIVDARLHSIVFGHGYMSERPYLSRQGLSWTIDAHSNILQSLYGLGLVGSFMMIVIWLYPIRLLKRFDRGRVDFDIVKAANYAFIGFGMTSSYFYSRPSISAIFFTTLLYTCYRADRTNK